MRKLIEVLVSILIVTAFSTIMVVAILEWLAGCGESYTDAYGVRHQHECLFIDNKE